MLNPTVQVSVNSEYLRKKKNNPKDKNREVFFAPYLKKNQQEKERNIGNFSSHTRSSLTFSARSKELFFGGGVGKGEQFAGRLDKSYLRLATENKRPVKKGWNQPWFREWLSKDDLLKRHQEWSLRGGKRIGQKFLSFLDFDIEKEDLEEWRKRQLRKNVELLLRYLGCFYVETKRGFHVYMLSDELLPNEILYHVDSWLKKEKIIGSIQSKGKYVVGFDSKNKKLVENGKWFWHVKDLAQVKDTLTKFFLIVGKLEKVLKDAENELLFAKEFLKMGRYQAQDYRPIVNLPVKKLLKIPQQQPFSLRHNIQAKILSKHKTCLADIWKIFYLDWKSQKRGYFLVNSYQKSNILPGLTAGSVRSIWLISGRKHDFFSRAP